MIDKVARDGGLEPGDTFLFNDPYEGGTHLNDFRLVRPIFRDGQLFCWLASVGHWLDIGGNVPGGYNPKATESHQEGVRFPPVKLFSAGRLNQDIVDILAANSRLPMSNWGDLNGQLNALDLGERRLGALIDDYGAPTLATAFDAFSERAEALMRSAIRALPDGRYSFEDVLDNDGITDELLTVALDLTIAGDRMELDFSRSSPPAAGTDQHLLRHHRRRLLCRAEARLHRCARPMPAASGRSASSSPPRPCSAPPRRSRWRAIPRRSCG